MIASMEEFALTQFIGQNGKLSVTAIDTGSRPVLNGEPGTGVRYGREKSNLKPETVKGIEPEARHIDEGSVGGKTRP
jgi:hypothetical protein